MSLAIFTMVQNETYFLEKWLAHYGAEFGFNNMYVLNHGTFEGPAGELLDDLQHDHGFDVVTVNHAYSYDHSWMRRTVQKFQHFLLQSYDTVLHTAADQYLVPMDGCKDLRQYLHNYAEYGGDPYIVAKGFEVVQGEAEDPIDWSKPIFEQHQWVYPCYHYTRPVIAKIPLYWKPTLAGAYNVPEEEDTPNNIALVHLHRVDFDLCLKRHREISARLWRPEHRKEGPYRHNMIEDHEMLQRWLRCNSDDTSQFAKLIRVGDTMKGRF